MVMRRATMMLILGAAPVILASCGQIGESPPLVAEAKSSPGERGAIDRELSGPASLSVAARTIDLRSSAFTEGAAIPAKYTCKGEDLSPPLSWNNVPTGTRSLALLVEDPDAPFGVFTHWALYGIPAESKELPEGILAEKTVHMGEPKADPARQGTNDFKKYGYGGPCPPSGTHHYHFHIYALDRNLDLSPGATRKQLLDAMKGHVMGEGELVGIFAKS
jgi:Raf kinase inhibitor-like YbhB/YbcL family protein